MKFASVLREFSLLFSLDSQGWLAGLKNADQRITEDVEKFAFTVSELYSYTFKVSVLSQHFPNRA